MKPAPAGLFGRIVHCDWSLHARGRWMASACRDGEGRWHAAGPEPVPDPAALVDDLVAAAGRVPTLAAFDFPIGFPVGFGARSGFCCFPAALDAIDRGAWPEIFKVAATAGEIGPRRPFYPARPGGTLLRHLLDGHGVDTVDALVRDCERAGPDSGAAGCMFWTLGAKQVGKAALLGWREVIVPARRRGARLWPFAGDLAALSRVSYVDTRNPAQSYEETKQDRVGEPTRSCLAGQGGLVLAESYPADAYGQIGIVIRGKRDPRLRAALAPELLAWAGARGIRLAPGLAGAIGAGFPPAAGGDDGFDAVVGLLAAIAVDRGERPAGPPVTETMRCWEGWILGKRPAPPPEVR